MRTSNLSKIVLASLFIPSSLLSKNKFVESLLISSQNYVDLKMIHGPEADIQRIDPFVYESYMRDLKQSINNGSICEIVLKIDISNGNRDDLSHFVIEAHAELLPVVGAFTSRALLVYHSFNMKDSVFDYKIYIPTELSNKIRIISQKYKIITNFDIRYTKL